MSDIFTTRLKTSLPAGLKFLADAINDKPLMQLNLSHNAFGPAGVESLTQLLATSPNLNNLDLTNCGLGPEGTTMVAESILKCDNMKLKEFRASRDRLEDKGFSAMAAVFKK